MTNLLVTALMQMDDLEFRVLKGHLNIADYCRGIMEEYSKDAAFMRERLNLSDTDFEAFIRGAYEISLREISTLEILNIELRKEKAEKTATPPVTFPDYEDSKPPTKEVPC